MDTINSLKAEIKKRGEEEVAESLLENLSYKENSNSFWRKFIFKIEGKEVITEYFKKKFVKISF